MTKPAGRRGAELIGEALAQQGIKTIFSLSGNQIMPVYDALHDTGIRIIHTRHEGAAVYMAEAAAQVSGEVSVALLTAGPGFANGLSAIYTARESETPILILTGDSPVSRDGRGAFQELDQCTAATAVAKATFRCVDPAGLGEDIIRAIALAKAGRPGPVHLALPDDVLRQVATPDPAAATVTKIDGANSATDADLAVLAEHIGKSERPVLLAGPAFCRPRWKQPLADLAENLNIPVITFESPRGLRAPRLGAFAEVIPKADCIITLGKPLNFMTGFGDPPLVSPTCAVPAIRRRRKRARSRSRRPWRSQPHPVTTLPILNRRQARQRPIHCRPQGERPGATKSPLPSPTAQRNGPRQNLPKRKFVPSTLRKPLPISPTRTTPRHLSLMVVKSANGARQRQTPMSH